MKFILTLIIFFIPCTIFAGIHGKVELGYVPEIKGFESILDVEYVPLDFVSIYGGIATLMRYNSNRRRFGPYRNTYSLGVQLRYKQFYFDIRHYCIHPVITVIGGFYDEEQAGNKTKFSIGIIW